MNRRVYERAALQPVALTGVILEDARLLGLRVNSRPVGLSSPGCVTLACRLFFDVLFFFGPWILTRLL
jgi:hypothetical protein